MTARRTAIAALLLAVVVFGGCGNAADPPARTPDALVVPEDPQEALNWARAVADDPDRSKLIARLDAWIARDTRLKLGREACVAITWRLRLALQDGDLEKAAKCHAQLQFSCRGVGTSPEGQELSAATVRLGIFEECLLQARRRIDGAAPDLKGATRAVEIGEMMLLDGDKEDRERLLATFRWVERSMLADMFAALDLPRTDARAGPRLVAFADDFALGEDVFLSVLGRWQRDGAGEGFKVEIVPLIRGQVRMGLRLVPAESRAAELGSIRDRVAGAGLGIPAGYENGIDAAKLTLIGFGVGDTALVLVDKKGRIVARLSGRNVDPREIEPAVQRLLSR